MNVHQRSSNIRRRIVIGIILVLLVVLAFFEPLKNLLFNRKATQTSTGAVELFYRPIASDLFVPWEIIWGPDDWIWFTQRDGYIRKLDPASGELKTLLHLDDNYEWTSSGTLGMILYTDSLNEIYTYFVYTYSSSGHPNDIYERCLRYKYDSDNETLTDRTIIIDSLHCGPSGTFGSRLLITSDQKLLMTTGCDAYDITDRKFNGGITLRLNLDGSIPDDNPFPGSYIYTYGHRNHQGLAQGRNGIIYFSEHGPSSDDELNILEAGRNYGWPYVWAECNKEMEIHYCDSANVKEPIKSWTPTIAPCGLAYYDHALIPEWRHSLIMATLKESDLRVLALNEDGSEIISETIYLDDKIGRIRDICFSPDGRIFLSTSHFERLTHDLNMKPKSTHYDKIIEVGIKN